MTVKIIFSISVSPNVKTSLVIFNCDNFVCFGFLSQIDILH